MKPSQQQSITLLKALDQPGKPLLILFAMLISGRTMVGESDLTSLVDANPKTIRKGLAVLNTLGLITRTHFHNGWQLTTSGRQMMLNSPMLLPTGSQALPDSVNFTGLNEDDSVNFTESGGNPVKRATFTESDSVVVVNDSQLIKEDLTTTTNTQTDPVKMAQFTESGFDEARGVFQAALRICEATKLLCHPPENDPMATVWKAPIFPAFAKVVAERHKADMRRVRKSTALEDLYGWIAYCCDPDMSGKFWNPAGLVASHIKANNAPPEKYRQNPGRYLPDEFLIAAGLEQFAPRLQASPYAADDDEEDAGDPPAEDELDTDQAYQGLEDAPSGGDDDLPELNSLVYRPIFGKSGMSPAAVWRTVLQQLSLEMPKAAFDTYPGQTYVVDFERPAKFYIQAPSQYAAEWLTSRLASTVTRLLMGYCYPHQASVVFVPPSQE
jgi:hypothetical protein